MRETDVVPLGSDTGHSSILVFGADLVEAKDVAARLRLAAAGEGRKKLRVWVRDVTRYHGEPENHISGVLILAEPTEEGAKPVGEAVEADYAGRGVPVARRTAAEALEDLSSTLALVGPAPGSGGDGAAAGEASSPLDDGLPTETVPVGRRAKK